MSKMILIALSFCFITDSVVAQSTTAAKPDYSMYNNMFIKPKRGHEKQFEQGVKAHNAAFHASGPSKASLSIVTEGSRSDGWYIWGMGPLTYTDMDHMPQGDAKHDDDWDKNVDAHVEEYGESNFWKLKDDLSYTPAGYNPSHLDVWVVDIKPGKRYLFAELMKKNKAVWEAKKYPFSSRVFYNDLWSNTGRDASIVYNFDHYADFDMDIKFKEDFESVHGVGSYDNFWKSWNECVNGVDEHLRKILK
ncbi:MAG: hypothetical protein IPJ80_00755 [Saprospiraceae bacterium]|nr:hypothetical protein [Saprospiraceae bacterium]